ncbi:MAG: His/Gly/Thr/Pro-type tRNA ligase C-terminal domain-containing protein, partial [Staphylococcus equorum]|nr:His/Gly/Thr/Pro-type tRNA ligase C-terminal domain-containing protein [Staphylococcus equorum]
VGEQELEENKINVKNMESGETETIKLDEMVNYFKN